LSAEEKWCIFFRYHQDERKEGFIQDLIREEEGLMHAEKVLTKVSKEYEEWARVLFREKAEMDYRSGMHASYQKMLKENEQRVKAAEQEVQAAKQEAQAAKQEVQAAKQEAQVAKQKVQAAEQRTQDVAQHAKNVEQRVVELERRLREVGLD
jgi:DNA repair ATPase RecN